MKLFLMVSLFLIHLITSVQNSSFISSNYTASKDDSLIRIIRRNVIKINSDSLSQKIVTKNIEGESSEGGEVKKYFHDEELCKAMLVFYGEMGKDTKEYYFIDNELIFLFERKYRYNKPISEKGS